MATLRDVADLAGVDQSTASRVLRDDPGQAVRPDTRERIQAAARKLGYRPNAVARSLRTRRPNMLGLVMPDIDNIGFMEVVHGVEMYAAGRGYMVLLADAKALDRSEELYGRLVLEGRVDGLLAAFGKVEDPLIAHLVAQGMPLVLVNRQSQGIDAAVIVDDYAGSRLAVDHLVSLGHRVVGHLAGPDDVDTAQRRLEGFVDGLAAHGLEPGPIIAAGYSEAGGRHAALQLLEAQPRPTAVFAANLMSALGAVAAIKSAGVRIPGDMSVIAMDEHPIAAHTDPPMTTVAMPLAEMGTEAARMLIDALEGTAPARRLVIETPPRLIRRESTGPG
jgi:LacI family transcriptional regulator